MKTLKTLQFIALVAFISSSCAPLKEKTAEKLAQSTSQSIGCEDVTSHLFNFLAAIPLEGETFPDAKTLEKELTEKLLLAHKENKINPVSNISKQKIEKFVKIYLEFYQLTTEELPKALKIEKSKDETLAALVALELGDQTSQAKQQLQSQWQKIRPALLAAAQELNGQCEVNSNSNGSVNPPPPSTTSPSTPSMTSPPADPPSSGKNKENLFKYLKNNYPAPVYGSMKTLAVAYQSCEVLNLSPMNSLSPDVKGISVVGRHPGGGNVRQVTSLTDVVRTHYYIHNQEPPVASCAQLKEKPLIYDFGGKPAVSASLHSSLDFFSNAGTGSKELGTDCSGFVFTSYATAGLKMKADQPLKALQVMGISAGMIKEPQTNGLNCLNKVYANLQPGDLIASSGHVVMVDSTSEDPFGIASLRRESDCQLENIKISKFDFIISQSSPSKGAIGINRMTAASYFATSSSMGEGLRQHGLSACLKKFGKSQKPNTDKVSVVRHLGTEVCRAEPITLAHQECLDSCEVTYRLQ